MRQAEELCEFDPKELTLSDADYGVLKDQFSKRLDILRLSSSRYLLTPRQYVGTIVLSDHILIIRPKIPKLNFFLMLAGAFGLAQFRDDLFGYKPEPEILEIIMEQFVKDIEVLTTQGISEGYTEVEENLSLIRGRIQVRKDIAANRVVHSKVFCRFDEFSPDTLENQILKYALYLLSRYPGGRTELRISAQRISHYFQHVTLRTIRSEDFSRMTYNTLNQHYERLVSLARLVIENLSLNFGKQGEIRFASFLVDMNNLFEEFLRRVLKEGLREYNVRRATGYYLDVERRHRRNPDIAVGASGREILVADAKYKLLGKEDFEYDHARDHDVDQIVGYCHAASVSLGILLYPVLEGSEVLESPRSQVRGTEIFFSVRAVDLTKSSREAFLAHCESLVSYIRSQARELERTIAVTS